MVGRQCVNLSSSEPEAYLLRSRELNDAMDVSVYLWNIDKRKEQVVGMLLSPRPVERSFLASGMTSSL